MKTKQESIKQETKNKCETCYANNFTCKWKDTDYIKNCPFYHKEMKGNGFKIVQENCVSIPDEKDLIIAKTIVQNYNNRDDMRVGDYLLIEDKYHRFSHDWIDSLQYSEYGSFSISESGSISFSGALERGFSKNDIEPTDEMKEGTFWFPHHGWLQRDCAINLIFPVRVYKLKDNVSRINK